MTKAKDARPTAPSRPFNIPHVPEPHAGSPSVVEPEDEAQYLRGLGPDKDSEVHHPSHYTQGAVECIDAIEAATKGLEPFEAYCTGAALKYIWRWKHKNGEQDIDKAIWYLNYLKDTL